MIAVAPATEPWQIVIVFDAALTSSAGLSWAADALTGASETLVELGEVTILVSDPTPRTLLAATRDQPLVSLSELQRAFPRPLEVPKACGT